MTDITRAHHTIKSGSAVEITFEGNPSTGFDWDWAASDETSLARVEIADLGAQPPPERADGASPFVGAPVRRSWRITALKSGTAHLIFSYRRSWERVAPIRTHIVVLAIVN